jgi:CheY-like chemotaxis protein
MAEVSLLEVIDSAVEAVQPIIARKRQSLQMEFDSRDVTVTADAVRLAQVVGNLLTNASKYSGEATRIALTVSADGADRVALSVVDQGVGLTADDAQNIFRMFWQSSESNQRTEGGLGIGLALSRSLVQMHGGSLTAHSAGPGQGSRFTLVLPRHARGAAPAAGAQAAAAPEPALRIVVADDNEDAAVTLALALELQGHQGRTAHDGSSALAAVESFAPQVALLDLGMPGLSGWDLARHLRDSPAYRDLTLAAITGWGSESDRHRAREAGFDEHFVKPVDLGAILAFLNRRFGERPTRGD